MSNPYKTRTGGATVTVFVPYDCGNRCPFCINKQEYANTKGFSADRICDSIRTLDSVTPHCDFVFTGGEPLANLESLQKMLDIIPNTHRIFINSTLPVMKQYSEDEVVDFLNRNAAKITCVNVSRHLQKYVVEGGDEIFARLKVPLRINCVLFGSYTVQQVRAFIERFRKYDLPIQFRSDYTHTTPENLYDRAGDEVYTMLDGMLGCSSASGCRMRCNYSFGASGPDIAYHKTLPYSTIPVSEDGRTYDVLYDIIVKQNGDIHSDWTGTPLDMDRYRRVAFEPYDLHDFKVS